MFSRRSGSWQPRSRRWPVQLLARSLFLTCGRLPSLRVLTRWADPRSRCWPVQLLARSLFLTCGSLPSLRVLTRWAERENQQAPCCLLLPPQRPALWPHLTLNYLPQASSPNIFTLIHKVGGHITVQNITPVEYLNSGFFFHKNKKVWGKWKWLVSLCLSFNTILRVSPLLCHYIIKYIKIFQISSNVIL